MFFVDTLAEMGKFMDSGGNVLWMIVILLFFMWTLIFERVWYLTKSCPRVLKIKIDVWSGRKDRRSKFALQIREKVISEASEITFSRICRANFDLRSFLPDHTSILILRTLGQDFVRYQTLSKIRVHIKKSNITIIQSTLPPESMNLPISASVSTKNIDYLLSKEPAGSLESK